MPHTHRKIHRQTTWKRMHKLFSNTHPFRARTQHRVCQTHQMKIQYTQPTEANNGHMQRETETIKYMKSLFFAIGSDSFPFPTFCHEMRARKRSRISFINQNKNRIHHNHSGKRRG